MYTEWMRCRIAITVLIEKLKRLQTYHREGQSDQMNQKLQSYLQNQSENCDKNHNFSFSNDLVIHDNNVWLQLWIGRLSLVVTVIDIPQTTCGYDNPRFGM